MCLIVQKYGSYIISYKCHSWTIFILMLVQNFPEKGVSMETGLNLQLFHVSAE